MRKFNAVLSVIMIGLFLYHALAGSGLLTGLTGFSPLSATLPSIILAILTGLHIIVGIKLTVDTLAAQKRSGAGYFRENRLFWLRRISGYALILLLAAHIFGMTGETVDGSYIPHTYTLPLLLCDLILAAALMLHLSVNIKPLAQSFGFNAGKGVLTVTAVVLSAVLIVSGAAFIIYFAGWQT